MNPSIHLKQIARLFLVASALIVLTLSPAPKAFGVVPAPDGGYPGGNTAEGHLALGSLTTGAYNTALGVFSLLSLTDGNFNTGVGAGTLLANTGDENTATGAGALFSNTTGSSNTANGAFALFSNTEGADNTAVGAAALLNNTTGGDNTAIGQSALLSNEVSFLNTAVGSRALSDNTFGSSNTAIGADALHHNTTGNLNTAIGQFTLSSNETGAANTAIGQAALQNNVGHQNTAVGAGALPNNTIGHDNIALGFLAGNGVVEASNVICIGAEVSGADVSDSCYIGNIFDVTAVAGSAVFVSSDNKLGTITSSKRFKEEINPMDKASEALLSLKPVTFRYNKEIDPAGRSHFGLVAEDVEKVSPDLVVRDKEGKPYSVRYDQVNAMLLNEFLKAHRKIEEQGTMIAQQQKQIEALAAGLQKVGAQLELNKPAPQTVANYR
jgi:trimeric autotransporter adhesin